MPAVNVEITRWVDDYQPGIVECKLIDAAGEWHFFIEKTYYVSIEDLWPDSNYPRSGQIDCEILDEWTDENGRTLIRIDSSRPHSIESTQQKTIFTVLITQLAPS